LQTRQPGLRRGWPRAGEGGLLSSIVDSEIAALEHLRDHVSDEELRGFSQAFAEGAAHFHDRKQATALHWPSCLPCGCDDPGMTR